MSSYSDLNDRGLIGMIKNCMLQDKVNDQQIIDILKEQIVYLKNEINHKNTVITCSYHNNGEKNGDICNVDNSTYSSGTINDSFLNNINTRGISKKENMKVLNHPGATSEDLKDFINPTIRRKPNMVVLHIGTNDISENIDTISNLHTIVKRILKKSASTTICCYTSR